MLDERVVGNPRRSRPLTVVANRLPVEATEDGWAMSPGGLVAALEPVLTSRGGLWVGWDGVPGDAPEPLVMGDIRMVPVPLTATEVEDYYGGFCNATLWPLYHDKVHVPQFHHPWWQAYQAVNQRFARAVAEVVPPGGAVWVHDYHLSLVPGLLRGLRSDLRIGYFLHTPFPPAQLFAQLPWRRLLLQGMLGADSAGFQTLNDARNFREAARRHGGAGTRGVEVALNGRVCRADAFPISIDTRAFSTSASRRRTVDRARKLKAQVSGRRILLGVDRLDYTKGIEHRLRALEALLDRRPELAEEIVFVQVAVPSREDVDGYSSMREEIERLAGRINGTHGSLGHNVVDYTYASLDRDELIAYYRAADVMVVTPPRDGMNLVAKEYVACRVDLDGVLVLSEFAGAAQELDRALLANPFDLDGTARALEQALAMSPTEQRSRMLAMRRHLFQHDVYAWAEAALGAFDALP